MRGRTADLLEKLPGLDAVNKTYLEGYLRTKQLKQLTNRSIETAAWRVFTFLKWLDFKDARAVTATDIADFFIDRRETRSPFTVQGFYIDLKAFYKYLLPEAAPTLFDFKPIKPKRKLPSDQLLLPGDVQKLLAACETQRDRALVAVLWDSAARVDEILSRNIGHVQFDKYGATVVLNGKTGERQCRLTSSAPDLQALINTHPRRDDPTAPVFVTYRRKNSQNTRLSVRSVQNRLKVIAERANVTKPVHPHALRHGRLTQMAKLGFNESELRIIAGWEANSAMPAIYLHLSGQDVERKMLALEGLVPRDSDETTDSLSPKPCPRCRKLNPFDARFCSGCSLVLDIRAAQNLEDAVDRIEELEVYRRIMARVDGQIRDEIAQELARVKSQSAAGG